jgi:hypothetical protein
METALLELEPPPTTRVPPLPRVDLYGPIHRGLRLAHGKMLALLATTAYAERTSSEATLDELETQLDLAALHLALEDRHYHPALEARRPHASERLDEQHRSHAQALAELRALAAKLSASRPESAPAVGRALYLRYASFVAEDLAHMAEEELVTLPLFHELYTDRELETLQTALIESTPPRERGECFRLIIAASDHETRVELLARVRSELPAPAFAALRDSLRGPLSAADYARLLNAL